MASRYLLLIHNSGQVVQISQTRDLVLKGLNQNRPFILNDGRFSIVVNRDGNIEDLGTDRDISTNYQKQDFESIIDADGKSIIPGFVDGHTHALWAGDRVSEFSMKLAGKTYRDIHAMGGGINSTVKAIAETGKEQLKLNLKNNLNRLLQAGTTTAEVKSGYGLNWENEMKMLQVIEEVRTTSDIDISSTYCGAHSVPEGSTAEQHVSDILDYHFPQLEKLMNCGKLKVDNCDVFCEKGFFDTEQTKKIIQAGQMLGMNGNFHAEELSCLHSAEMGSEVGVAAMSHLEEIDTDTGVRAMSEAGVVATLLPTTAYALRLRAPPARAMIDAGVPVALGSDLNPNAHCLAMPMVMNLACVLMHMTMEEALVAATLNAAHSLRLSDRVGSIEIGKQADLIILNTQKWENLIYEFGCHLNIIDKVIKKGRVM